VKEPTVLHEFVQAFAGVDHDIAKSGRVAKVGDTFHEDTISRRDRRGHAASGNFKGPDHAGDAQ
jgi:hypothetical protein